MDTGVGAGERVIGRQHRLAVAAAKTHRFSEAGDGVGIEVLRGGPKTLSHSGRGS